MAPRSDGKLERMPVEERRDNVFACFGEPVIVLPTHMDEDEITYGESHSKVMPPKF